MLVRAGAVGVGPWAVFGVRGVVPGYYCGPMSSYVIRAVRADEWPAAKELRLAALRDPVAYLAFLETYEEGVARPDSFWKERTAGAADGADSAQQIIAEGPDGRWVGMLTVLVEEPGTTDWAGFPVERKQGHVVGVFVLPEERGSGLTDVLFDAALEWSWAHGARAGAAHRARGERAGAAVLPEGGVPAEWRDRSVRAARGSASLSSCSIGSGSQWLRQALLRPAVRRPAGGCGPVRGTGAGPGLGRPRSAPAASSSGSWGSGATAATSSRTSVIGGSRRPEDDRSAMRRPRSTTLEARAVRSGIAPGLVLGSSIDSPTT